MSKFVDEILQDIKDNPNTFTDIGGNGIKKDNIEISGYGNTRVLSIIHVFINNKDIPKSWLDNWRLEVAVQQWYRTVSLDTLKKT